MRGIFPTFFFFCTFSPAVFSTFILLVFLYLLVGVFVLAFPLSFIFYFFLFFSPPSPRCSEPSGGLLSAGRRRRALPTPRRGVGVQRCPAPAVGARRRAALMTNTLGRRGHRAAFLPRGRERPAGAQRAAAVPAPGGKAGTRTDQVSGSVSSRIPRFLQPSALPSLPPPFVFHHLPSFRFPFSPRSP